MNTTQPIQVRTYQATDHAGANALFQEEANALGSAGYRPTAQQWSGPPMARRVLTPIVLLFVATLIGSLLVGGVLVGAFAGVILALTYLMAVKPKGTLSVTYTK